MGFRYWYEGVLFVVFFGFIVAMPCFFIATLGSKTINQLGNFPTKTAKTQVNVLWKISVVEIVSFMLWIIFFRIFS